MPCVQPGFFSDGYDINKNKKFLQELGDEITLVSGTIGIHYDIRHLKKRSNERWYEKAKFCIW